MIIYRFGQPHVSGSLYIDDELSPPRLIWKNAEGLILDLTQGLPSVATWGDIIGLLSDQTDLQGELDGKAPTTHVHPYEPANANIQAHVTVAHEAANANIQAHVTGTGSPHTAAGVGAEAAGAVAAHAVLTTAHAAATNLEKSANIRYWIGIFSANPDAIARGTGTIHLAAFSYDTGLDGTLFWRCATSGGVANTFTTTVTTQSIAANTAYMMRIVCNNTTGNVKFYINDVLVATHVANLPTATQLLGYGNRVTTLVAAARNIKWSRIAIRRN